MNINLYSLFYRLRAVAGTLLIIGLLLLASSLSIDSNNTISIETMTDTWRIIPYLVILFVLTVFSWLMVKKFKAPRTILETAAERARRLYGIIGISLIILFLFFVMALPVVMQLL